MNKGPVGIVGGRERGVVDKMAWASWAYYSGNFVIPLLSHLYVSLSHYV